MRAQNEIRFLDIVGSTGELPRISHFSTYIPGLRDEVLVSKLTGALETVLAAYETILSKQKYLAGEELTLADLYHLPYGTLIKTLGFAEVFARYPSLNAWFYGLGGRESWIKTTSS